MKSLITTAASLTVLMSASAIADDHTGSADFELTHVAAVLNTGPLDPAHDEQCDALLSDHVGLHAHSSWEVNTTTGMMSATTTVMDAEIGMFPMGISGHYDFMSSSIPSGLSEQHVDRIILNMDDAFENQALRILFVYDDQDFNCVLSSDAMH